MINNYKTIIGITVGTIGGVGAILGSIHIAKKMKKSDFAKRKKLAKQYETLQKEKEEAEVLQDVIDAHNLKIEEISSSCFDKDTGSFINRNGYENVDFAKLSERSAQLSVFGPQNKSNIFLKELQMHATIVEMDKLDKKHPFYKKIFKRNDKGI